MNAVEACDLRKTYKGGVQALDGLSFEIESGTIFGLLGPNGAGKSTTVKILTTLSRADSGEACVAGHDVVRDAERVRRSIGVVGQKPGFDPDATGRENLVMQAEIYGVRGTDRRARVDELLERRSRRGSRPVGEDLFRGCSGGSTSPSASSTDRRCCSSTSPPPGSTRGARGVVAGDRAPGQRGGNDDPAHHPLSRRGRSARVAARDRRPWPRRGPGEPGRAQERASGDTVQVELAESSPPTAMPPRLSASPGMSPSSRSRGTAPRPRKRRRGRYPIADHRSRAARPTSRLGGDRAPSLDDVYLRHAGRSFRQVDTTQTNGKEVAA